MAQCYPRKRPCSGHQWTSQKCRLCCKSLFAPLIANFSSCRRGFRVNMCGTSSPGDKFTGDFGNEPDATSISDRGLFRLLAGNLSPGVFRLLQHNLPTAEVTVAALRLRHFFATRLSLVECHCYGRHGCGARLGSAFLALSLKHSRLRQIVGRTK